MSKGLEAQSTEFFDCEVRLSAFVWIRSNLETLQAVGLLEPTFERSP